jgi:hypothetical protein
MRNPLKGTNRKKHLPVRHTMLSLHIAPKNWFLMQNTWVDSRSLPEPTEE